VKLCGKSPQAHAQWMVDGLAGCTFCVGTRPACQPSVPNPPSNKTDSTDACTIAPTSKPHSQQRLLRMLCCAAHFGAYCCISPGRQGTTLRTHRGKYDCHGGHASDGYKSHVRTLASHLTTEHTMSYVTPQTVCIPAPVRTQSMYTQPQACQLTRHLCSKLILDQLSQSPA
jgi:hypothetical protein